MISRGLRYLFATFVRIVALWCVLGAILVTCMATGCGKTCVNIPYPPFPATNIIELEVDGSMRPDMVRLTAENMKALMEYIEILRAHPNWRR